MIQFDNVYINGLGASLPQSIRKNNDPVFDDLKGANRIEEELFKGYDERRYLRDGELIEDFMVEASTHCIQQSDLEIPEVTHILGYSTVSAYNAPNGLALVSKKLGLSNSCLILPINNEFNNLNTAVMVGGSVLQLQKQAKILCTVGSNFTKHVNYNSAVSLSAGDGAGALLISGVIDNWLFKVKAFSSCSDTSLFGSMNFSVDTNGKSVFNLQQEGVEAFKLFGMNAPISLIEKMLIHYDLNSSDVAMVVHQASTVLIDHWVSSIKPGQVINSINKYGNMISATGAVNLALYHEKINKKFVIVLGLGIEHQATVLLLEKRHH